MQELERQATMLDGEETGDSHLVRLAGQDPERQPAQLLAELGGPEALGRILSALGEAVVVYDTSGVPLQANQAATDTFGPERVTLKWEELAPSLQARLPDGQLLTMEELPVSQALRGQVVRDQTILLVDAQGRERTVLASASPIRSGDEVSGAVAAWRDITKQAQIEQELRESQEKLGKLFEILPVGISVLDQDRNVVKANPALSKILDLSAEELLHGSFRQRTYRTAGGLPFSPQELPSIRAFDEQAAVQDIEIGVEKEDGELIWTSVSAVPVPFPDWKVVVVTADATDRKRAEEELRRERDLITAVLDTSGGLVVVLDRQGRIVRFNRACERVTGYRFEEVQGRPFWDFLLAPEEVQPVKEVFSQLQADQVPNTFENSWLAKNGSRRWIAWSNTVLAFESGSVEYIIGTGIDITERRRAEEALQAALSESQRLAESLEASETRFRSVVETASAAIVVADSRGRITFWNRMAERIFGYATEEMIGAPVTRLVPERFRATHEAGMQRAVSTGLSRFTGETVETVGIRKGGDEFPLEMSVAIWKSHAGHSLTVLMHDITQRRQFEEALRDAKQSIETLIAASPLAIVALDLHLNVRLWNPAAERIFGWRESEVLGHPYPLFPETGQEVSQEFQAAVAAGQALAGLETVHRRKAGSPIDVSIWTAPLRDAEGRIRSVMAVIADITDRKRAEEALRQYAYEQTALFAVASAVASTMDQDELLAVVLDAVLPVLGADAGWVLLPTPRPGDPPRVVAERGTEDGLRAGRTMLPVQDCPLHRDFPELEGSRADLCLVTDCLELTSRAASSSELQSLVCIPLCVDQSVLGVLKIGWRKPYAHQDQGRNLLLVIGRQIGMALHNAQLYEAARQVDRLRALSRLDRALATTLELKEIAEVALHRVAAPLGVSLASVLLLPTPARDQPPLQVFHLEGAWEEVEGSGLAASYWQDTLERVGDGREAVHLPAKAPEAARHAGEPAEEGRDDDLAVPVWGEEALLAVLVLGSRGIDRPFTAEDQALAQVAASSVGQAMQNAQLYDEVRRLLHEQQQTRAALIQVEKVSALGRLSATVAHEINNPLQSVQSCLTLIREEMGGEQRRDKVSRYLDVAGGEVERISAIVRRMREYYRPAHERLQPTDLHAVLDSVLDLSDKELQHRGIRVQRLDQSRLPVIQANPDHLKQVFLNLVLNAMDAMPDGGILRVRTCVARTEAGSGGRPQPAVRIEISDTGHGMPPEVQARMFEPFFTTKEDGAGLGLSVSYSIIEAHSGQISVDSEEGVGTTFTVMLPVVPS